MDANFHALLDYIDGLIVILKLGFMNYFGSHSKLPFWKDEDENYKILIIKLYAEMFCHTLLIF